MAPEHAVLGWPEALHPRGFAVRPQHVTHGEALDQVSAGLGGCLNQQRVQDGL
jgi:hypothetical protein